jgi:hypothetical protein
MSKPVTPGPSPAYGVIGMGESASSSAGRSAHRPQGLAAAEERQPKSDR